MRKRTHQQYLLPAMCIFVFAAICYADELDDAKEGYNEARLAAARQLYDSYKVAIEKATADGSTEKAERIEKEMKSFIARERAALKVDISVDQPVKPQAANADAKKGKPNAPKLPNRNAAQPILKRTMGAKPTQFGQIRLPANEIAKFIADCKAKKADTLTSIQGDLGGLAASMSANEIAEAKSLYKFLSQDSVLIAPRSSNDPIFKPIGSGTQLIRDSGIAVTEEIIDKTSAYVSLENTGDKLILEGVDTTKLPAGKWNCHLLLKVAGTRKVNGIVGAYEVKVFQAVSDEGFPKDVIIW